MAERRMFSKTIINSARFLRMPPSSRLLYYDLGMAADDDGVAEAFTVLRTTGATEDDLRVLVAKGFIVLLNDDLVSFIVDWKQNNSIRPDRRKPSVYTDLLVKLSGGNQMTTDCLPSDNQTATNGMRRLEEGRLEEERVVERRVEDAAPARSHFSPPSLEEVTAYCQERGKGVDPSKWYDHYTANGWMVGRNRMKDWRAAVRTWESNGVGKGGEPHGAVVGGSGRDVGKLPSASDGWDFGE